MPCAVTGAGVEAGLVVLLRLRNHDLRVVEVGDPEVGDRALCLLGELEAADVVVDRVRVVVPDAPEHVRRVLDVDVLAVDGLVVLRLHAGPRRPAHRLDERRHPGGRAVRVVGRLAGRRVVERAGLAPAPEDEVDLRRHLDVSAEVRHVHRRRRARDRRPDRSAAHRRRLQGWVADVVRVGHVDRPVRRCRARRGTCPRDEEECDGRDQCCSELHLVPLTW